MKIVWFVTITLWSVLVVAAFGLSGCQSTTDTSTLTDEQVALQTAEKTLGVLKFAAQAYEMLPVCGSMPCHDATVSSDIDKGIAAADNAAVAAQVPIFGCSESDWRNAHATPPTATCGQPSEDMDAQDRALADFTAALAGAKTVLPIALQ